jgi:hypothetical protein
MDTLQSENSQFKIHKKASEKTQFGVAYTTKKFLKKVSKNVFKNTLLKLN